MFDRSDSLFARGISSLRQSQDRHNFGLQRAAGDLDFSVGMNEDVDLAAYAKLGQINAGLDGEEGSRKDSARLIRFQIVHMRPVAMHLLSQIVTSAMAEVLAVSRVLNHSPHRVIHLAAR